MALIYWFINRTRLGIGRSFQLTNIFPSLTVLENVRLAVQARRGLGFNAWRSYRSFPDLEDRAWELLEAVLLETRWQAPAGLLAHGEKRKLELGILLALLFVTLPLVVRTVQPVLLEIDEAEEEAARVLGATRWYTFRRVVLPKLRSGIIEGIKARRDKTILLVEHKIDMVMALSDSIAVLKDGRLIADGSPQAVSGDPAVQAAYFGGAAHAG